MRRSIAVSEEQLSREIRVFVSGTFLDMQPEREYLVKHVFPEVRQLCRERGVTFTEVDLRWGITQSEARRGKIVALCLEEVLDRNSHVIALLGDRYGWRPSHDDVDSESDLYEAYSWLPSAIDAGRSIVEIETLEAARHLTDPSRIRFYARKSTIPRDLPLPDSLRDDLERLDGFKERIFSSGLPVREGFVSPQQLGEWVRNDLVALLDSLYPAGGRSSWLERERNDHEGFAATRRRAYVENRKILAQLDGYVEDGAWRNDDEDGTVQSGRRSLPLVITGESGAGKSALLAHWSEQFRRNNPDTFLVTHYVGATASSTDFVGLLRRVMQEIRERFQLTEEPPADPERIVNEFPQWLAYTGNEPLVLVVDAMNQLEPHPEHLTDLRWLPEDFLPHVRILLSCLDSPLLHTMQKRKWPEVQVQLLNEQERREVARRFLGGYSKRLDKQQLRRVASHVKSANPLYLRTSLEELRVFGKYEELNERIDHYLDAEDLSSLFDRVLERIERDYGGELVTAVMRFLWGSRHGLSEEELGNLAGVEKAGLSQLIRALDYHLMRRDGLLTFFHNHLREAARKRYVRSAKMEHRTHRMLGEYFSAQPLGARRQEEEPWQWREANAWEELEGCLTDIPLLCNLCEDDKQYEVLRYWQAIPDSEERRLGKKYSAKLAELEAEEPLDSVAHIRLLETLGGFLFECADYEEAEGLYRRAWELREIGEPEHQAETVRTLTRLGAVLQAKGDYEEAEKILRRALALTEELYGREHLEAASALEALATLLYTTREYRDAQPLCARALAIRERVQGPEHVDCLKSISILGAILLALEQTEEGIELLHRAQQLSEKVQGPEHPMTAQSLNNLAAAFQRQRDYERAIPLLERAIEINKGIFGLFHPEVAMNLTNLAIFERLAERFDAAEEHYRQALKINIAVLGRNHAVTARNLLNLGILLKKNGFLEKARDTLAEALEISLEVFGPEHLSTYKCQVNLGILFIDLAEYQQALPLLRQSLPALQRALGSDHWVHAGYYGYLDHLPAEMKNELLEEMSGLPSEQPE